MKLNEEQRARPIYYYFGWQGGTVHQLASETGLSVDSILYSRIDDAAKFENDFGEGLKNVRTLPIPERKKIAEQYKGNSLYWYGVMSGFWLMEPLDGKAA